MSTQPPDTRRMTRAAALEKVNPLSKPTIDGGSRGKGRGGGRGGGRGRNIGAKGGKGSIAEAGCRETISHSSHNTESRSGAQTSLNPSDLQNDDDGDIPSTELDSMETLLLPFELQRAQTQEPDSNRPQTVTSVENYYRTKIAEMENQLNILKRSNQTESQDILQTHLAKRLRTNKKLPDPSSLQVQITSQNRLQSSNNILSQPKTPSSRIIPTAIAKNLSKTQLMSTNALSLASSPATGTGSLHFRLPKSQSTSTSGTPPPITSLSTTPPIPCTVPSIAPGLLIAQKPENLLSYTKEYQEIITQAKHYMHLFLVTEDAFPELLTINKFVTSALYYANKDFPQYPDIVLTECITKIIRSHIARTRNKWKALAQEVVNAAYELGTDAALIKKRGELLLEGTRWVYGRIEGGHEGLKEKRLDPFGHPAIASIIISAAYEAKDGVARLRPDKMNPIPLTTLAFTAVTIMNSLHQYTFNNGYRVNVDMEGKTYGVHYRALLENVKLYNNRKPDRCLQLQERIHRQGMSKVEQRFHGPAGVLNTEAFVIEDSEEDSDDDLVHIQSRARMVQRTLHVDNNDHVEDSSVEECGSGYIHEDDGDFEEDGYIHNSDGDGNVEEGDPLQAEDDNEEVEAD